MSPLRPTLPLALYGAATGLLDPVASVLLRRRARRGKEDPARLSERLGRSGRRRPEGPLIWLHGVSVGESLSLLPLVAALRARRPAATLLVTSGTVTSPSCWRRACRPTSSTSSRPWTALPPSAASSTTGDRTQACSSRASSGPT